MNKKIMALGLATVVLFATAGAGTMAWFTTSVTSESNTFQAGTLSLSGEGGDVFAAIEVADMQPGEPGHEGSTILRNNGTLPLKLYKITADNIKDDDKLDEVLDVVVEIADTVVYEGKLSQLVEENGGHFNPMMNVAAGQELEVKLLVKMNEEAGNKYQGASISCDFSIYAAQENMPLTGQVGGWEHLANSNNNLFSVKGNNDGNSVKFDIDWASVNENFLPNQKYQVYIKHQTGDVNSIVQVETRRIFIWFDEIDQLVIDGDIDPKYVSFQNSTKTISISKNAFPTDWEIIDVKFTGMRKTALSKTYEDETNYVGWHLNR